MISYRFQTGFWHLSKAEFRFKEVYDGSGNCKIHVRSTDVYPGEVCGVRPLQETSMVIYHKYCRPGYYVTLDAEASEPDAPLPWNIQIVLF